MAVNATDPVLPLTEDLPFSNFVVTVSHDWNAANRIQCNVVTVDRPCFLASLSLNLTARVGGTRYFAIRIAKGEDLAAAITAQRGLLSAGDGDGAAGTGKYIDGNPSGASFVTATAENGGATYRIDPAKARFNKGDILAVVSTNGSNSQTFVDNAGNVTATFVRDD